MGETSGGTSTDQESSRVLTQADQALVEAARAQDVTVTPTQLKRWRAAGLLPTPNQVSQGRGAGRRSIDYPEGSVERVVAISKILAMRPEVPLAQVLFWLFLLGHDVDLPQLRAAFAEHTRRQRARLPSAGDEVRIDAAVSASNEAFYRLPLGRFLRQAVRHEGVNVRYRLRAMSDSISRQLLGERPVWQAFDTIGTAFGLTDPEDRELFIRLVRRVAFRRLVDLLEELDDAELLKAADNLRKMIELLSRVADLIPGFPESRSIEYWAELLRIDGYAGIVGVIQLAHVQRELTNLSDRLVEEINALRNVPNGRRRVPQAELDS